MPRKKLGEILLAAGVIDESRLRSALMEQRRWGGYLGRVLIDMKLVSEEVLVQALSQQLNFPAINLDNREIGHDVLDMVSGELAEQHSMIPFNREGKFLDVAMTDPTNLGIIDELRIRTQLNVRPYLAGPKMLERAVARFYGRGQASLPISMRTRSGPPGIDPNVRGNAGALDLGAGEGPSISVVPADQPLGNMSAAQRRAQAFALTGGQLGETTGAEIANLQERISKLEALIQRDEDVIRKLLGLLVEKGIASREEILERIK
jgi:hypothetical protein